MWRKETDEVALAVQLEAVRHDFTGEAVTAEQSLHTVGLHLSGKHVTQQLVEKVLSIEKSDQNPSQLILQHAITDASSSKSKVIEDTSSKV